MTTTYTGIPTLRERAVASPLVIIGRVEKIVDVTTDYRQERPQVRTTFLVHIESTLKGNVEAETVEVKVAGGKTDTDETPWSVRLQEGDLLLLMLAPNYAERNPDVFVPYFGSSFPVTGEDEVELSEEILKQIDQEPIRVRKGRAKLDDLRRLVEEVVESRGREEAQLAELEPEEWRKLPYKEIQEMPQVDPGGPRPSAPEPGTKPGEPPA